MRWYLPNMVITAIVPCFTVINDDDIMITPINTKTKMITNPASMIYKFDEINIEKTIGELFVIKLIINKYLKL